jgi:UDP-N-acetylmuramate dehydrogenase
MKGVETARSLASLTTIGVGGAAQHYRIVEDLAGLKRSVEWSQAKGLPMWVLSGGSNLVVADQGLTGLVVDLRLTGIRFEAELGEQVLVTAAAGENWDRFVSEVVERGYSGLECLSGIPGRVGATPIQNVGAYGQDVSQTIHSVDVLDRSSGERVRFDAKDCNFGYRSSRFRQSDAGRYVVVSVCFSLARTQPKLPNHRELAQSLGIDSKSPTIRQLRAAVMALRRSKSMVVEASDPWSRSCGSFFVNPVVSALEAEQIQRAHTTERVPIYPQASSQAKIAAAWLIERAGFRRGYREGAVGVSEKHSLAIVAQEGATADDVVRLARRIQMRVHTEFGIWLLPEPVFWGFEQFDKGLPAVD